MSHLIPHRLGWIPDLPDPRDYTLRHTAVLSLLEQLKLSRQKPLPDFVDLRCDDEGEYFTQPEDQGPINSSTAFAVLSLVEYFERRTLGRAFKRSKRFLYKVTRNLRQRQPIIGLIQHSAESQQSPTISHSIGEDVQQSFVVADGGQILCSAETQHVGRRMRFAIIRSNARGDSLLISTGAPVFAASYMGLKQRSVQLLRAPQRHRDLGRQLLSCVARTNERHRAVR